MKCFIKRQFSTRKVNYLNNTQKFKELMLGVENSRYQQIKNTKMKNEFSQSKYNQVTNIMKKRIEDRNSNTHYIHFNPNAKCNQAKVTILSHQGHIFGYQDDCYNSNDLLLNAVESKNPKAMILGHMAYTDYEYLFKGEMKYFFEPRIEKITAEQTLATKKMSRFFETEFPQSLRYFNEFEEEKEDYSIYEINRSTKRRLVRPQLAISKFIVTSLNKKLFFGSPNPLLLIEDICENFSLQELKYIFDASISDYYQHFKDQCIVPASSPLDIHENLINITMNRFAPKLYSNLITYQASLLRKCTKLYKETGIMVNNLLVDYIKSKALDTEILEFDEIFTRTNFEKTESLQDRLQKVSILTHLLSREFQLYLNYYQGDSLMKQLWNGAYYEQGKNYIEEFDMANLPQRQILTKLYEEDIQRMRTQSAQGRLFIESYPKALKRLDKKCMREYRFLVNPLREMEQIKFLAEKLFQQIERNVLERESQGIDQLSTRLAFSAYIDNKPTFQDVQLIKELIIEANTQLGLFAFPEQITNKYKDLIKRVAYDCMNKHHGEDAKLAYKRKLIETDNQNKRKVYTQLSDGSVPSFEEFKSIKDQIVRTNQGIGAKLSPVQFQKNIEETTKQYLMLQQIAQEHPGAADRVKNLQKKLDKDYLPLEVQGHQRALYLDDLGQPKQLKELYGNKCLVYSPDGTEIPFDVSSKTLGELQDLGFKEITNFSYKTNPMGGIEPEITAQERERMRKAMEEMKRDEEDPDSFQDDIDFDFISKEQKKREEEIIHKKALQQNKIDQYRVSVIYKALEKGVPIEDEVYYEALELYPVYKKKLKDRQDEIKRIQKMKERQEEGQKVNKYKFEEKIKGRRNLQYQPEEQLEVETTTDDKKQEEDDLFKHYETVLDSYQKDQEEIQKMMNKIEKDVVTGKDAEDDFKRFKWIEEQVEKKLGDKYRTNFDDDEGGSTIGAINQKYQGDLMMQKFMTDLQQNSPNDNPQLNIPGKDQMNI